MLTRNGENVDGVREREREWIWTSPVEDYKDFVNGSIEWTVVSNRFLCYNSTRQSAQPVLTVALAELWAKVVQGESVDRVRERKRESVSDQRDN